MCTKKRRESITYCLSIVYFYYDIQAKLIEKNKKKWYLKYPKKPAILSH